MIQAGKEQFIGTWRLISSEFRRSNGEVTYPMGINVAGMLMYDADGNMSAQIMRVDRNVFSMGAQKRFTARQLSQE